MNRLSVLLLGFILNAQLGAQILNPAELGLPLWKQGDPIEVLNDGQDGFWIRGPAGVLAVDGNLVPRPWAATLYVGSAGGLEWFPYSQNSFVIKKSDEKYYLFHARFPQGIIISRSRVLKPKEPPPPEFAWLFLNQERTAGVDVLGQIWRLQEKVWIKVTQMAGATSVAETSDALYVLRSNTVLRLEGGKQTVMVTLPSGWWTLHASGNSVVMMNSANGIVRLLEGTEERVTWDFWDAVEQEAKALEANLKGVALEQLAQGVANLYRQRFGSFGPWLDRVNLGRRLRAGFGNIQVRWSQNRLSWMVDPDDRNTATPLDVMVVTIPTEVETVQRRVAYRGDLPLDGAGAIALWIQFFRGREVQEIWVVEEP